MNRFVFGRGWVFSDETNGEGDGNGTGGGAAPAGEGAVEGEGEGEHVDEGGEAGGKGAAAPGAKKEEAPKDMKTAIDAALGYKKGPNGEALDPLTGKVKEEPKTVQKPGVTKAEVVFEKHANGAPKKNAAGDELDDKGQVTKRAEPPKAKTSSELQLSREQLAVLKPEARERFQQVITTLKAHEGTIAKQTETIKGLTEGRDGILSVMQETNTTSDQLAGYLHLNALLQSDNRADVEKALRMVESQRLAIYKALGIEPEGGGIDLLADFPDLKEDVTESRITRERALEIAQGRRDRAARDQAAQRQQNQKREQTQSIEQRKQADDAALADIDKWVMEVSRNDLDYKAKEDILMPQIDEILKEYEPKLWLPTIKRIYANIVTQKSSAPAGGGHRPLRPSGAKPGDKKPGSMLEAINQGLGYATPAKG